MKHLTFYLLLASIFSAFSCSVYDEKIKVYSNKTGNIKSRSLYIGISKNGAYYTLRQSPRGKGVIERDCGTIEDFDQYWILHPSREKSVFSSDTLNESDFNINREYVPELDNIIKSKCILQK